NRTVREESGAWSLLKKAAVRARPTANSSEGTTWPKLTDVGGAPRVLNTARRLPARSATATTMGAFADITAFCTTVVTSALVSGTAVEGGGAEFDEHNSCPPPPPQDKPSSTAAQATREIPEIPTRSGFLLFTRPPLSESVQAQSSARVHKFTPPSKEHEIQQDARIISRRPLCLSW